MARLSSKGGKRILIKKIETQSNIEVTFSKRRNGVFRKACELSLLCDCDVAVIIFTPEDNIFAFGEPSVEHILATFMNQSQQNSVDEHLMEDHQNAVWFEPHKEEMTECKGTIEAEKTRDKTMAEVPNDPCEENISKKLWLTPVEDLTLDEAEKMLEQLEEFKHSINSYGGHEETNEGGSFPFTPHPNLPCTSGNGRDKGKAPKQG